MQRFVCPSCQQRTVDLKTKVGATSFQPARCPGCRAAIYPSGKKTYLLRSLESLIVTLIVVMALIDFSWLLVGLALAVILVMESLIVLLVPLVELRRQAPH